ncbi:hypothetical protein TAMA11512_06640 [Selenomonas sp. TAMA-11512]|uniref:flagellar basal body P-ring formation chaperone FlgA n=1 Tax=Selenomonas sp. TAMA-11512 TaxID=3095337 RepID=UPI003093D5DF|nr:hypothetical protein TAMA11512_06640 [Selenomonas sp. TAMA-11512]
MRRWQATGIALLLLLFLRLSSAEAAYGPGMYEEKFSQKVTTAMMEEKAREKLDAMLRDSGETRRHEITLEKPANDMQIPAGQISVDASIPTGVHYGKRTPVHAIVYLDGKVYRRAIFYYRVRVYDRVLVASRNLFPSDELTAADVHLEEREVFGREDKWLRSADAVVGKQPRSLIEMGKVLTKSSVVSPILIEAGTEVTMVSEYNGIEVRAAGVALARGRAGQRIRVRNALSRRVVIAEVINSTTVRIVK